MIVTRRDVRDGAERRVVRAPAVRAARPSRSRGGRRRPARLPGRARREHTALVATTDRRETESGIEVKPVYTAEDAASPLEAPGEFPYTRGPYADMYRGRPWTMRQYAGFASAEESNERYRYLLAHGQTGPLDRVRSADAARATTPTIRAPLGEVGRTGVAIDSIADMEVLLDGIPLGEVSTSMTINAPASLLLLLYELVAEARGIAGRGTARNGAERHPQGVHRARELHLPAAAVDAPHDRSVRVLRRAHPVVEHDLDLRATTSARQARPRCRSSRSRSRTASRTATRRSPQAFRRTSSASGSRSSSTRTTTSSRRSRSSARRGGCGRGSCASGSARRTRRRSRCASMRRPAARR